MITGRHGITDARSVRCVLCGAILDLPREIPLSQLGSAVHSMGWRMSGDRFVCPKHKDGGSR